MPADKESVFWLSVQEIPQKSEADNTLQIAVRQRIKLFYRPTTLSGTPEDSATRLQWQLLNESGKNWLLATNPSPYHVSLSAVTLKHGGKSYPVETEMVAPGTTGRFLLKGVDAVSAKGAAQVNFSAINDYGVPIKHVISITR